MADAITPSEVKAALPVKDLLIRGFLSGAFLGIATSLAYTVRAQPLAPIAAAVIFPVGFVLLALLGLELATGNFAILPMGLAARRVSIRGLLRNWTWVYVGNLAGCLFYALFFYWALTSFGHTNGGTVATQFKTAAVAKTVAYQKLGATVHDRPKPDKTWDPYPITVHTTADPAVLAATMRATWPDGVCTDTGVYYQGAVEMPLLSMYTRGLQFVTGRVNARAVIPEILELLTAQCDLAPAVAHVDHREAREAALLRSLAQGTEDIPALVRAIYIGLDPRLTGAAGLSVLAHLEDLVARGIVATDGPASVSATYRLASG